MTLRQREPRQRNEAFLKFVRAHPCCVCFAPAPSQAAHIRMGSIDHGKRQTGVGERPSDCWSVPLCARCHLYDQHCTGERLYWRWTGIDPIALAQRLYAEFEESRRKPK